MRVRLNGLRACLTVADGISVQGHSASSGITGLMTRRLKSTAAVVEAGLPTDVTIVEVGPRDGLQNEKTLVPTAIKVEFIDRLARSGVRTIEATSFVSPKWVPQLADAAEVMGTIRRSPGVLYTALTPNLKGFERALESGAGAVAVFAAASEEFSRRNINCSVAESLQRFEPIMERAREAGLPVRGYVSCVVGCPYQGEVTPGAAADVAGALHDMGCYEVSMGDTTGVGTPASVKAMFEATMAKVPVDRLAAHFHDTYGQAVANIYAALQMGVAVVDSSVAGLGGCPYSPGASGNVSTEDVLYLLEGLGIRHGIDTRQLVEVGDWICAQMGRDNSSRAGTAMLAQWQAKKQAAAAAA